MFNSLELIIGPVCSGKSSELLRRIDRYSIAGYGVLTVKPSLDKRSKKIKSRTGIQSDCVSLKKADDVFDTIVSSMMKKNIQTEIIAFDEGQFFEDIFEVSKELITRGFKVIVSALDTDFNGAPFGGIPQLVTLSDSVLKLTAICMTCKCENAIFNQKLKKGGDLIEVGDLELYQPRCINCFVPGGIEG